MANINLPDGQLPRFDKALGYCDGAVVSYAYDPQYSNVTQKTDERGTVTKYEYDPNGNLVKLTEAHGRPEQRSTEYTHDAYGNRLTEKRPGDAQTQEAATAYTYDTKGNATAVTDAEGHKTGFTRDALGNALVTTDARGKAWTRAYNSAGNLTSEKNPLGHATRYEYDKAGRRIKTIDALNNVTQYAYDARDNLVTVTDPYTKTVQYAYNADGRSTQVTDQEGKLQRHEYDPNGRLVKTTDGNGNATQYVYGDEASGLEGLLTRIVYPTFAQELKYDTRNRVVQTIAVLNATTSHTTAIAYDAAGNQSSMTDPEGKVTQYSYDALNRLTKITDPANGVTEHAYDNRDNLTSLKDPRGQTHRFEYDKRNLKTKETRPLGQAIAYAYDAAGNLTQTTDPKGQVKKYSYDAAGGMTAETNFEAQATTPAKTVSYSYNELRRLTGYDDGATSASYAYDNLQRKTGESVNYGPFTLSHAYSYYANGQKKTFTGPDGLTYSYTYDPNNQLNGIQLPVGSITVNSYTWTAPEKTTLPGGATRVNQYDPLLRLTNIAAKDAFQNSLLSYQYAYDKAGNITQKATEHGTYDYGYDSLYRLKTAANPGPLSQEAYGYDALGNRTSDSNLPGPWSYDENSALLSAGAVAYDYDDNGNAIKKTAGAQTMSLAYDTGDRLTEAKDAQGNTIAKYAYDPFGRRLWKEVNNTRTWFFYADEGLIGEYDSSGAQTKAYGYQPDSTWTTDPVFQKTNNKYYFYQNDHLGTPQKLTDTQGNVVWSARGQGFGETIVDAGSTVTNNLRFAGQYYDAETGLHYNWMRYYDPKTGRYFTSDPIGLAGSINTYLYARANPLSNIDPDGLKALFCCRLLDSVVIGSTFRQRHCYFNVDGTTYGLYPEGNVGIPRINDPRDRGGICKECEPLPCSDVKLCIKDQHDFYPIGTYNAPLGPNSNTYAGTIAMACCKGGVPSGVGSAPSIGDDPPVHNPPASRGGSR